jgi:signal transduction histidine kinase/ActR/RegA family two-component response regulator
VSDEAKPDSSDPLAAGGGAVGALLRATDWTGSSLGLLADWPLALKAHLRSMLSTRQPMGIFWGPELIHLYNDGFLPILGEKHPRSLGERAEIIWADAWPTVGPDIERVTKQGAAVLYENALVPIVRGGVLEDAWWNYSYSPIHGDDGALAGALLIVTEVTAAVRARMELEQANRAAEIAREHLFGIFMQAPVPMAILEGPEHRFTLANAPYVKFVGREVVGKPLFGAFSEEEAGYYLPFLDGVLHTGEPVLIREAPVTLPDEHGRPKESFIDAGYYPRRNSDGVPVGVLAMLLDVTGQVAARKVIERGRDAAEAANRAKDEFLATISHELRTPLMAILGWADILRTSPNGARLERGLEVIARNAHAQAKLIEDILDASRIITGKMRLALGRVNVARTIGDATDTLRPAADAKAITIAIEIPDGTLSIVGDQDRVQQIVWNLVSNAVKFTPKAGSVIIRAFQIGSEICIQVEDTGRGISPAFLPFVFDRFRQDDASTTKQQSGLGLGLAIVRQLVELHGGTISVRSDGNARGALFEVILPVRAVAPPEFVAPTAADVVMPPPTQDKLLLGVHLLVVDDQDDARELVAAVLEDAGAVVSQASSAQDALTFLATNATTNAIVSDIGMPDEDGYSFIQRVRASAYGESARALPALALTAFARAEDRQRALESGFQEHVAKPIEPGRLVAAVARLVQR